MKLEDAVSGLFGATGFLTMLAGALQTSPDVRLEALGGLLVAFGVVAKAFIPNPK
jgi:hypothetical protein